MRVAVVFGQFGAAADPVNLPHFRDRLTQAGVETILVQHTDSQKVYDFLKDYPGKCGIAGASLGAGAAPLFASYLRLRTINFAGGFQPSDWDPVMHAVQIVSGSDVITRAVNVTKNVLRAVCFRNPNTAMTGGLGHATYVLADGNNVTNLTVHERLDVHPGDFGPAQDIMFDEVMAALK
jgi:hypothetical protein